MSWIIIKSSGDEYSFTVSKVPGDVGHTYQYAQQLAERVTVAMKASQQNVQPTGGMCSICGTPITKYCPVCKWRTHTASR